MFRLPGSDFQPLAYDGPDYDQILAVRKRNVQQVMKPHFKKPLLFHQGYKQWLFDQNGKRYLDMFAGIVTVSVGHAHPYVINFNLIFIVFN